MTKAHSILGASSSSRWLACPGSIRLSKGMPKSTSSYADEGTSAHSLAEMCLRTDKNAVEYLGTMITTNGTAYEVTAEMAEAVQVYLDVIRGDYEKSGDKATLYYEKKFHLDWLYEGLFGTNDAMIGEPFGTLRVYDYKHGAGVAVDVNDNPQMMYYALGAAKGAAYEDVELVIVQPRAPHKDGTIRRYQMPIESLMKWAEEVLLPGAKATEDPNAPLHTGEHCRFCPALAVCPVQKAQSMEIAKAVFADKPASPPAPEAMTKAELKKVLDVASMVEAWLNACRAHVRALLETGAAIPEELGYKLVNGRASRKWTNEVEAEKWLVTLLDEEAYVKKLLSPAQAEKFMRGTAKKMVADMVTKEPGGVQLAPLSDPREAVKPAISVFEEVEL